MSKTSNIFLSTLRWFNILSWPSELIGHYRDWRVMRRLCKEESALKIFKSQDPEIRFDKIYRLYTVINIPEELYPKEYENARQTYLIEQLRKFEEVALRLGVSEILYPEFAVITDVPDSFAYLLVLETNKEGLTWINFLLWIMQLTSLYAVLAITNNIIHSLSGSSIIEWISTILPF
jgi:hypothetical protein